MRKGLVQRLACVALAGAMLAALSSHGHATPRRAAAERHVASDPGAKSTDTATRSKNLLRQFTGYVSAIDKSSITVEKRGKKPETRVFTKHDEMRTTGDVEKDARVTVYYREEGGKSIAHRVVVKPARTGSKSRS